jgi:hypothetical protein
MMVYEEMVLTTIDNIMTRAPSGPELLKRLLDLSMESRALEREYLAGRLVEILKRYAPNIPPSAMDEFFEGVCLEEIPSLPSITQPN